VTCGLIVALCSGALAGPEGRVDVIDADTIRVSGETVRLFGIDAPEKGQPCTISGRRIDCGLWATAAVEKAFDDRGRDRYGRLVAKCAVGAQDMGEAIVVSGFAEAFRRYSLDYVDAEKQAIVAGRGIWAGEMAKPSTYRDQQRAASSVSGGNGCSIKGNISGSGRIYHMPGQEHYDRTRINASKGERWFCSEAEARAAGWRRARR